eukprot:12221-Rhodomonas_salina.1
MAAASHNTLLDTCHLRLELDDLGGCQCAPYGFAVLDPLARARVFKLWKDSKRTPSQDVTETADRVLRVSGAVELD